MSGNASMARLASALLLATCSAGCASAASSPSGVVSVTSDSGALKVEVRTSPEPPARGTNGAELTVTNVADGTPRDGLTVTVVPWMAAMNHGSSTIPTVSAAGGGRYEVTGLDLFMPGHWVLRTTFSGPVDDHAEPALDIP